MQKCFEHVWVGHLYDLAAYVKSYVERTHLGIERLVLCYKRIPFPWSFSHVLPMTFLRHINDMTWQLMIDTMDLLLSLSFHLVSLPSFLVLPTLPSDSLETLLCLGGSYFPFFSHKQLENIAFSMVLTQTKCRLANLAKSSLAHITLSLFSKHFAGILL